MSVNEPRRLSVEPSSIRNAACTILPSTELAGVTAVAPELKQGEPCTRMLPVSIRLLNKGEVAPFTGFVNIPPCCRLTSNVTGVVVDFPLANVSVLPIPT
jgi:hypothetical protein